MIMILWYWNTIYIITVTGHNTNQTAGKIKQNRHVNDHEALVRFQSLKCKLKRDILARSDTVIYFILLIYLLFIYIFSPRSFTNKIFHSKSNEQEVLEAFVGLSMRPPLLTDKNNSGDVWNYDNVG